MIKANLTSVSHPGSYIIDGLDFESNQEPMEPELDIIYNEAIRLRKSGL